MQNEHDSWKPLATDKLSEIKRMFGHVFSVDEYDDLAEKISDHWIEMLRRVWREKSQKIRDRDERYQPSDPLSRIQQQTVVIVYADSVQKKGEKTLTILDAFLRKHFPAIRGMHMLPACTVVESRFNDGFFSQVVRDEIHESFGTNEQFSEMMEHHFSMADFVLNHVDINNPIFQAYLNGDNKAGECFYVCTEENYQKQLRNGDFAQVFRPRPFPLFTIFRRKPEDENNAKLEHQQKVAKMNTFFKKQPLPEPVVSVLSVFNKVKNDQMLLADDYRHILNFRNYLETQTSVHLDDIFKRSAIQETKHEPYIFQDSIHNMGDLLEAVGISPLDALEYSRAFQQHDPVVFGREIRALTTFSHVQVDLNTTTYQGLKMLADDCSWYLKTDLDMLRLDAANFAFKKWKTSCFGLPEVKDLMTILYLSMDCVSPRIVANLEVNDQLSSVLTQMADKKAPPPMMYDFHLASLLPVVFNTGNAEILLRIFKMIADYDIPKESIRFSLAESHDGKSVRGSLDLLTLAERQNLADAVEGRGGKVKYKSVPRRQYDTGGFQEVCKEAGIDIHSAGAALFKESNPADTTLYIKDELQKETHIAQALGMSTDSFKKNETLRYFINKAIYGREPYELCTSTRDCLVEQENREQEADRYLAFYTLAFVLMGRNVKSIYFNDLLGLPNDYKRAEESGELRDIKRTKARVEELEKIISDPNSFQHKITRSINNLIALVDADPALNPRGNEARAALSSEDNSSKAVAAVHNYYHDSHSLVLINVGQKPETIKIDLSLYGFKDAKELYDNISGRIIPFKTQGELTQSVKPYQRIWFTKEEIDIPSVLLV